MTNDEGPIRCTFEARDGFLNWNVGGGLRLYEDKMDGHIFPAPLSNFSFPPHSGKCCIVCLPLEMFVIVRALISVAPLRARACLQGRTVAYIIRCQGNQGSHFRWGRL